MKQIVTFILISSFLISPTYADSNETRGSITSKSSHQTIRITERGDQTILFELCPTLESFECVLIGSPQGYKKDIFRKISRRFVWSFFKRIGADVATLAVVLTASVFVLYWLPVGIFGASTGATTASALSAGGMIMGVDGAIAATIVASTETLRPDIPLRERHLILNILPKKVTDTRIPTEKIAADLEAILNSL